MKLNVPSTPSLPVATTEYRQQFQDQYTNALRLYLNQLGGAVQSLAGVGGGQFLSFPYGSFYDTTTQTAAAINTGYATKFNTTDTSSNISVQNDGSLNPTKIVVVDPGIYSFVFSFQLYNAGASSATAYIWIKVNGTNVANSMGQVTVAAGQYSLQSWNFFPNLNAGDYLQLFWATSDTNVQLKAISAPSFAPASPSATITGNFVSSIITNASV